MRPAPFHRGEAALQAASGVRERMEVVGPKAIRDRMPAQHIELFEKLPTLFVGTIDEAGQPWATMVHGEPGFIRAQGDQSLRVGAHPHPQDPALRGLGEGNAVGLLGLEFHTRRRNRANGELIERRPDGWTVRIHQSYGNCPKYIFGRRIAEQPQRVETAPRSEGPELSAEARRLIEASDTLFIASASAPALSAAELSTSPGAGVDVSHRGGPAGFVRVLSESGGDRLLLPDYAGNLMFNTLGNLLVWPRAGLLFLDWRTGDVLQLAVTATLRTDPACVARLPGAERVLELRVDGGIFRAASMPLSWTTPEAPGQFSVNR